MLEIMDTAGLEQFTTTSTMYMKTAHGFMLVYSVTDPSSLVALARVRDQILAIKDARRVPMVVVGNKCDLVAQRRVSSEQAAAFVGQWNCKCRCRTWHGSRVRVLR